LPSPEAKISTVKFSMIVASPRESCAKRRSRNQRQTGAVHYAPLSPVRSGHVSGGYVVVEAPLHWRRNRE
jgi:hypothetical protein